MLRDGEASDHRLALGVLAVARNGGYLENATLRFVEREFEEDPRGVLRHKLGRYSDMLGRGLRGPPERREGAGESPRLQGDRVLP